MSTKKVGLAVAMAAAAGALVVGGAALPDAATRGSATTGSSTSASADGFANRYANGTAPDGAGQAAVGPPIHR